MKKLNQWSDELQCSFWMMDILGWEGQLYDMTRLVNFFLSLLTHHSKVTSFYIRHPSSTYNREKKKKKEENRMHNSIPYCIKRVLKMRWLTTRVKDLRCFGHTMSLRKKKRKKRSPSSKRKLWKEPQCFLFSMPCNEARKKWLMN